MECRFWDVPPQGRNDSAPSAIAASCGVQRALRRQDEYSCPDALAGLDSVQVRSHLEFFSAEPRHELVMLRYDNCARLGSETPAVRESFLTRFLGIRDSDRRAVPAH